MLHWPDNMVTWCPEEKILFSNDAFGQHYCTNTRFDDDSDFCETMQEAKKYYANIIMCYGKQAAGAWKIVKEMEPEMIAPSHGVIWRSHVADILNAYEHWSSSVPEAGALIVFDSMWHSTETMAQTIAEAFTEKGEPVKLFDLKQTHISDIVVSLLDCKYVAVGSAYSQQQYASHRGCLSLLYEGPFPEKPAGIFLRFLRLGRTGQRTNRGRTEEMRF